MEMKHGCTVMAPKLNKIYHNGNIFMTTIQQGKLSSMQQHKGNAYQIFSTSRYCAPGICSTKPNCNPVFLEVLRCLHNAVHNNLSRKWQSVALHQPPFSTGNFLFPQLKTP
jgi:hypothetical protein